MNPFINIFILSLLFIPKLHADHVNNWYCVVYDASQQGWSSQSSFQLMALNKAKDACKKYSAQPTTCVASMENCETVYDGKSTSPLWQCMALDFYANAYHSSVLMQKYKAAFDARADCKKKSDYPESCYVNLIACENMNQRM